MRKVPGVDFSSGSIGHNLSVGVGMALGARQSSLGFRTWALLGDGEMHEGQVWEAAMAGAHFKLGNLVAIIDKNQMCLDGFTNDVMRIEPLKDRWESFGWAVVEMDGHDPKQLLEIFGNVPKCDTEIPTCIIANTRKGYGVSFMNLSPYWHLGYLGPNDRKVAVDEIESRMDLIRDKGKH
jgi:transketolase